jgi:uncharacterized protein
MKIYLHEIKELDTNLEFTQDDKWVSNAVFSVDEKLDGRPSKPRPIQVQFNLRKVDEVVVISGKVRTSIELLCSRCALPYSMNTRPGFSALFCKDPVMAGVAHLQKGPDDDRDGGRPVGQNHGWARHAHDDGADENGVEGGASSQDLDITYISNDYIDLSDVLTEQLQIQVPFQPLCKEECKGMCAQCGADLNVGRCACAKIVQQKPFSVLKDFKL